MEVTLSADQVVRQIQRLHSEGNSLRKKAIKQSHPDLMRSALHYYPSWQEAVEKSGLHL